MESWSTYKTQDKLVLMEARKGGGEGENYQIGMEMRGQEIKRKAGGWVDLCIFVHAIFSELKSFFHGYFCNTKGSNPPQSSLVL